MKYWRQPAGAVNNSVSIFSKRDLRRWEIKELTAADAVAIDLRNSDVPTPGRPGAGVCVNGHDDGRGVGGVGAHSKVDVHCKGTDLTIFKLIHFY